MSGWQNDFDKQTLDEGLQYFNMGKAKKLTRTVPGYDVIVRGSRNYCVSICVKSSDDYTISCSCGQTHGNGRCRHMAAAMYLLDREVGVAAALKQVTNGEQRRTDRDYDIYDTDDYGHDYDYDYDEPSNREERRLMEKISKAEARKNRPARKKSAAQQEMATSAMIPAGELFPDLTRIQNESRREIAEDYTENDLPKDTESYRYFQPEKFRKGLNIKQSQLKEAQRLIRNREITLADVYEGYIDGENEERLVGRAEGRWLGKRNAYADSSITYNRTGLIGAYCSNWQCGCYYGKLTPSVQLCPHIIATILMAEEHLKRENPGVATNYAGNQLIAAFGRGKRSHMLSAPEKETADELILEPVASLDDENRLSVSFWTGKEKLYKIRELQEFVDQVRNREMVTFGKNTALKLAAESYSGDSAEWFSFIEEFLEEDEERKERRNVSPRFGYNYRTEKKISGSIPLYGIRLDHFFNRVMGRTIECSVPSGDKKKKQYLKVREGMLDLKLDLLPNIEEETGEFQGIRLTGTAPRLIKGAESSYCVKEREILRIKRDKSGRLDPVLNAARNGKIDIQLGRNDLGDFYHQILPMLKETVNIQEHDTDLIATYVPPAPLFLCYMDVQDGTVICRLDVWYGNRMHSPADLLQNNTEKPRKFENYRDMNAEGRVLKLLLQYIEHWDPELKIFFMPKEDLPVFQLLQEGIEKLAEFCEIHVTEAFRRLKIRRKMPFDVAVKMGTDLLELELTSDELGRKELLEIFRSYHQKKTFIRLKNGDFFRIDENETLEELSEMMDAMHVSVSDFVAGKMHVPVYRALYLDKMLEQTQDVYIDRDQRFGKLIKEFKTVENADYRFPGNLRSVFRNYQREGYRWLRTMDEYHFGAILADEMGLGKTLQAIAVILAAKEEETAQTSLVVCPASLVFNWEEELHRFAPSLKVSVAAGTKAVRKEIIEKCGDTDVLVTSYDLLKRDIALYEGNVFRYTILDEAQYIKNRGTAAAKSVKLIRSRTRFALTGTPIENRLAELWSIFDFLMPGFLYEYAQFQKEIEIPIVKNEDSGASERLRKMTAPFILRRRKQDVLKDLPEKMEEVRYAVMDEKQRRLYDAQVLRMRKDVRNKSEQEFRKNRIQILAELTKIRQICCDPSLLFSDYDGESAKRQACMELIGSAVEGEHKVLVFSQFTTMLELLEEDLRREGIAFYKIIGATPKEQRMRLVRQFNEDDTPVFLISLKAGGTGLNLTGADIVIHYDPWWNLAVQNQATDRAHRIGQKKIVTVYKLIAKGTIEEKILVLQDQKKRLADDILSADAVASTAVSKEDLMALLDG